MQSISSYNFAGAYCYVQLVQSPNPATAGGAMLALGKDVDNYYRIYVEAGTLIMQKIAASKITVATLPYNSTAHSFLRIRHDNAAGNVVFETAENAGGTPSNWVIRYTESWNTSAIPLNNILFELKAGTWQAEMNNPNMVIFDNFRAAKP